MEEEKMRLEGTKILLVFSSDRMLCGDSYW